MPPLRPLPARFSAPPPPSETGREFCSVPEPAAPAPGLVVPVPGLAVPVPGSVVPVSGSVVPLPGSVVPAPGSVVPVPGSVVPLPGSVVLLPGSNPGSKSGHMEFQSLKITSSMVWPAVLLILARA